MILKMQIEGLPWFRFEWHPENGVVYVIRALEEVGTAIAEHVMSEEAAHVAVTAFVAGYRTHANEPKLYRGNGPRQTVLSAETLRFGARLK